MAFKVKEIESAGPNATRRFWPGSGPVLAKMLSQPWPEIALRVYYSPVFLVSDQVNGLIVSGNLQASGNRRICFSGPCRN